MGRPTGSTQSEASIEQMRATRAVTDKVSKYLRAARKRYLSGGAINQWQDPVKISERIAQIEAELPDAPTIKELELRSQRRKLKERLETLRGDDFPNLEAEFIIVAKEWAASRGIEYADWRDMSVPADVLRRAGINRAPSSNGNGSVELDD